MDLKPSFLRSIEIHIKSKTKANLSTLKSFENLIQDKRDLEHTHNKIVKKVPVKSSQNIEKLNRQLIRSNEFVKKQIDVNSPAIHPLNSSQNYCEIVSDSTDMRFDEASFLTEKTPKFSKNLQTAIFYAEDVFGAKKPQLKNRVFLTKQAKFKSNFNNAYTRRIAGSSAKRESKKPEELHHDPLSVAEFFLPIRLRTSENNSAWTYSSIKRTSTFCRVKCKSRT